MARTLLTICHNVADKIPFPRPGTIIGNTNQTARQLLAAAQEEAEELSRRPANGWTILQREHTFATVASQAAYDLPSDFDRMIDFTVWNRSQFESLVAGLTPRQWQARKSSILNSSPFDQGFRIKLDTTANKFFLDPTPTAAENMAFEYISDEWAQSTGGARQTEWLADDDTTFLDDHLIELGMRWRIKSNLGFPHIEDFDVYQRAVAEAISRDGTAPALSMAGGRTQPFLIATENLPDTGLG